ncbi:MAG: hypothetical protein OQJ80_07925 [Kangiella sp.]|jgi:hypothetical protein|nr:hypothetical protein [Kangiella sp.]
MTKNVKSFIAFIISYFITRLSYYLLGYNPFEHNTFWVGLLIDFGIWVAVFGLILWLLHKISPAKQS